jgi:HSP20 family protein
MSQTALQMKREESTGLKLVKPADLVEEVAKTCDAIALRAFELFESHGSMFGRDLEDWFQAESELLHPAHVEVAESDQSFTLRAEVPGFQADQLEVSVDATRVTIAGNRKTKPLEEKLFSERCSDRILRVIELPAAVDGEKVKATLKDGILSLDLPKAAPAKKISVEIK